MENRGKKLLIGLAIFILILIGSNYNKETISDEIEDNTVVASSSDYEAALEKDEVAIFYLATPTCGYCQKFKPTLIKVIREYDLEINYINISEDTADGIDFIQNSDERLNGFGTPTLVILKDKKVSAIKVGAVSESNLLSFLRENNIIE